MLQQPSDWRWQPLNHKATSNAAFVEDMETAAVKLKATRPTAVNLRWAIDRVIKALNDKMLDENSSAPDNLRQAALAEAQRIADEDVAINKRMGEHGAELINDGDTILHHCNTGALAVVDWGTALGVIRTAHEQGKRLRVLVDETRPRLQGSRLTAWELGQYGIPYEIITDNMAGFFLQSGRSTKGASLVQIELLQTAM